MSIPPTAVFFGLLVASPTLWAALAQDSVPVDVASRRFIVILLVTALAWTAVQKLVGGFVVPAGTTVPEHDGQTVTGAAEHDRRSTDH